MKNSFLIILIALVVAAFGVDTRAQQYVGYPGAVSVVTQNLPTGNLGGALTSALNEPDLMQRVIGGSWVQARGPAVEKLKLLIGRSDLIASGVTLYDINCRLGNSGALKVRTSGSLLGNPLELKFNIAGNALTATSTQPTTLGKWADPRISVDFDLELTIKLILPTSPGPVTVQSVAAKFSNTKLDSQNLVSDVAFVFNDIVRFFGGPNLIALAEKLIDGSTFNFTDLMNKELAPLNALLSDGQLPDTIEWILNLPGMPGSGTLHGKSLPGSSANAASGPQLIFVKNRVPLLPSGPLRPEVASFIYCILNDGHLRWYRHNGAASGLGLETPGAWQGPRPVGFGWGGFKQVFAGGGNVVYAITQDGRLLWYRHNGFNDGGNLTTWEGPKDVGDGWQNFREVFPGSDGVIYAITADGILKWYRHLGFADGSVSWDGPKDVGTGWADFKQVFAMGKGVIYALTNDGTLKWYKHAAYLEGSGLNRPGAWFGPKDFGGGWGDYAEVFPGGEGVIYAITNDGTLKWYRHDNFSGEGESSVPNSSAPTGDPRIRIRAGVVTQQRPLGPKQLGVLSQPGFSLQPGRLEGPRNVSTGWNGFRQVFALLPRMPDLVR